MVGEGFGDYRPFNPFRASTPVWERLGLSKSEFVQQYGFGISTLLDRAVPADPVATNPNEAFLQELAPGAQQAFLEAEALCQIEAMEEVGPAPGEPAAATSDGLVDAQARAEEDPRIAAAKREYADCMADQGFAGQSGEALQAVVEERVAPLRREYEQRRDRLAKEGSSMAGVPLSDLLDPDQLAQLADIQQWEIRAALADHQCGELLYTVVREVTDEYVQRYLDGEE